MYVDQNVAPGDYVYYVTQVTVDAESDSSNYGYATVYGADDFPAPTDLMVEGNDYDAMLEWTAPDLSAWEPPAVMPILPSNNEKIDDPSTYINYDPSDYSTPRQGGDTDVDATVIEALPYLMMVPLLDILMIMMKNVLTPEVLHRTLYIVLLLRLIQLLM